MTRNQMIGAGVGAVVLLWGVAPGLLGGSVESALREQIAMAKFSDGVEVSITEYDRGWFSSTAHIEVSGRNWMRDNDWDDEFDNELNGEIALTFEHGPIVLGPGGPSFGAAALKYRLSLAQAIQLATGPRPEALLAGLITPDFGLTTEAVIGFGGAMSIHQEIPSLDFDSAVEFEGFEFNWGGYTADFEIDPDTNGITGDIHLPGVEVRAQADGDDIDVLMSNLRINIDMQMSKDDVWLGDSSVVLDHLRVNPDGDRNEHFELKGFSYAIDYAEGDGDEPVNINATAKLESLVGQEHGGEPLELGPAEFEANIQNLSKDVRRLFRLANGRRHDRRDMDNEEARAMVTSMLENSPEFNVTKASLTFNEGSASYSHSLRFNAPADIDLDDEKSMFSALVFDGTLNMDETFLRLIARHALVDDLDWRADNLSDEQMETGIANQITEFLTSGYVEQENGNYKVVIKLANGVLSVADKVIGDINDEDRHGFRFGRDRDDDEGTDEGTEEGAEEGDDTEEGGN